MPLPMSHHHTHRFCPLTSNLGSRTYTYVTSSFMPLPMSHHHTHRFCPLTSNVRSRADHAPMCVNVLYLHTYIYYIHIHIYIHTYIHTYIHVCIYVHENMYVCMYMCMYMYIHMYIHIHTPINRYEWYICTQIHVIWHARARVCTLYADVWKHKGTHIRWCDIVCKMMWHSMYVRWCDIVWDHFWESVPAECARLHA